MDYRLYEVRGLSENPSDYEENFNIIASSVEYCKNNNISYVTDSSNLSACYTRNKLRLEILPKIREINPSFDDAASRLIASAREETKLSEEILTSFEIIKTDSIVTP